MTLATQWRLWRTGRVPSAALVHISGGPDIQTPGRIWIDTDAACGVTGRTDPDDCFAILWLVTQGFDIAGISTSFGNAPGDVASDRVTAWVTMMAQHGVSAPAVFAGHTEAPAHSAPIPPGVASLREALQAGSLTILAFDV